MHRLYAFALIILLLCSPLANAQQDKSTIAKKIPSSAQMLNNSAQGREFWITIPPNEFDGGYPALELEIYVTSSRNAKVTIEHPGSGFSTTKPVKAYEITTFTTADKSANWAWEIRDDERASNQGIHIISDQPISVYALNAKSVSADGFLALPTTVWGTQYMHMSLYDFGEFASSSPWGGGFVIVAKENNTQVQFTLKGTDNGNPAGRTKKGKKLGTPYKFTLQRGQTYMVRGNGQTLNEFDFSGTVVTASKPIGFFSFHQRTMIPSFPSPNNGRDHLVEMIPPISSWGKRYVTLELESKANRGDFFRVFAKEKNTKFKCRYTDLKDNITYTWEGTLQDAGDFMERENTWPPSTSIKGVAVWTADKPIFVMQYACSAEWYGNSIFDPAMVIGVPVEQYTLETVFQTPANVAYVNNYFNILAIGDTNDITQEKLKTITIDGKPVWVSNPTFIVNRIQNTDIYWAKVKLPPGPHHIKGETPFGGVIYGFADFASYLWPAATALNKLDQLDTLKPLLDTVAECGDYLVTATEKRDQEPNEAQDSTQIDTGINQIELDLEQSYNYALELITADVDNIHIEPRREVFEFRLRVKDKSQDAFALYYVMDRAGNTAIDSVRYTAELVAMKPDSVIFGKVRVKTAKTLTAKIVNPTKRDVEVKNIWLKKNKEFKILQPTTFPLVVLAGTEIDIDFEYTPTKEIKKQDEYDIDSVFAEASCGKFALGWLQGQGVMPHIQVGDWDAGTHQVGTKYCNTNQDGTLLVENTGTDVLTITELKNIAAPFSLDLTTMTPPLPIILQPGEKVTVKTLCYDPKETGRQTIDVTFVSDADSEDKSNDNVSEWTGLAQDPGPQITVVDFGDKRVNTVHSADIILTNTGDFTLNVTGFHTAGDVSSLKVISVKVDGTTNVDLLAPVGDLTNFKTTIPLYQGETNRIVFTVKFIPQSETSYEQLIIPTYANSETVVEGKAIGNGILPHIVVEGDEFECIKQGTVSTEVGMVKITNTSMTADLVVQSVTLPKLPSAFELRADGPGQKMPTPADPLVISTGATATINAYFTADITTQSYTGPNVGNIKNYIDDVVIVADTKPGDGVNADGDFFEPVQTQLKGCDYTEGEPGIDVTDINFGSVLMCDTKTATFTVKNTGTRDLIVSDFLYTGNTAVYTITENGNPLSNPVEFILAAGATRTFTVTFAPRNGASPYDLNVEVVSNAPIDQKNIARLTGTGYTVPVTFTVVGSTKKLLPKEETELQFNVSGQIAEAKLNEFVLVLSYDPDALRYNGNFSAPGLNGWNVAIEPDKDANGQDARGKITIRGKQNTGSPLSVEGVFLKLKMNVYLSAKDKLPLVLNAAQSDLGNRAVCVVPSTVNGELLLDELCVRDFRGIQYKRAFALRQNTPNPSASETEIEYDVAFDAPVKLAVYNSIGEEVKVLVDGVREAGTYRVRITTTELPSGTYTYRLIAGPYVESRQMVITR